MRSRKTGKKVKVLVVDDHPVVREGLASLINRERDLKTCGEAEDAQGALLAVEELDPDVAIVDISLKGRSGLELIKDITLRRPHLPILVLSIHDESVYAERVLRAGARGYVMKHEAAELVVAAARRVLSGEIYLSDKMTSRMLHSFVNSRSCSPLERLSNRELEVFEWIGRGLNTHQIAERLHLSRKTIETHRAHIKDKLGIRTSAQLAQHATRWVHRENEN